MAIDAAMRLYSDLALDVYYDSGNVHRPTPCADVERLNTVEDSFKSAMQPEEEAANLLGFAIYSVAEQTIVAFDGWEGADSSRIG